MHNNAMSFAVIKTKIQLDKKRSNKRKQKDGS